MARLRSLPRGHEGVKRSRRRRQTRHGQRREGKKKKIRARRLRAIVVEAAVALTLGPSVRAYVRETTPGREVYAEEAAAAAAVARELVASKRCERNATLYPFYTEFTESRLSRVAGEVSFFR